jgi:hypothetical protein
VDFTLPIILNKFKSLNQDIFSPILYQVQTIVPMMGESIVRLQSRAAAAEQSTCSAAGVIKYDLKVSSYSIEARDISTS